MSAAQPKSSEPSMEEILASIRRIISDEPAKPEIAKPQPAAAANAPAPTPAAPTPPVAAAPPPPIDDDEVMELKPKARTPEPSLSTDDPVGNDVSFVDPAPPGPPKLHDGGVATAPALAREAFEQPVSLAAPEALSAATPPPASLAPPAPHPPAERLLSAEADRAASAAFASLANTVLSKNARTLDDLMQDMLRPMVKQWLDDNLPIVVERLVRAEIERVARGGR